MPLFRKLPAMFIEPAGAVSVFWMSIVLNAVTLDPLMVVLPLKSRVPLLWLNVPLFIQFAATLTGTVSWLVSVPEMVILLKLDVLEPLIVEVPLKITFELLWLKEPLFAKLPAIPMLATPAVSVPDSATFMK